VALKAHLGRECSSLAAMVCLGCTLRHDHISTLINRFGHEEFQLAGLVATSGHAGAIITLDPQFNAQLFRKPFHRLEGCGQVGKVNARETGKMHE
jgi:hypothetical protein